MWRGIGAALLLGGLVCCGLTVSGTEPAVTQDKPPIPVEGGAGPEPGTTDEADAAVAADGGGGGVVIEPIDAAPPPTCATQACLLPTGAGFGVALFGTRTTACPADFNTADIVEKPQVGSNACQCGTCTATGSNCNTGTLRTETGGDYDYACEREGNPLQANDGNCTNLEGRYSETASVRSPRPAGGTCSRPSTANKAAVTTTSSRLCSPKGQACAQELCTPPQGLKVCLVANGDVTCPTSVPTKHLVADDLTVTCVACGCTASASCSGSFASWSNTSCRGSQVSFSADTCYRLDDRSFSSYRWTGRVSNERCASPLPAAPAPTLQYVGARTVCCPP